MDEFQKATFGAGCFWCVEAVFQALKGVHSVRSGYIGGGSPNPTYREVCSGATGHAEAVEITFDSEVITYEQLLRVFWSTHDPTTLNQQGHDRGTQYRSVIFYHDLDQKQEAEHSKNVVAPQLWNDPIVTEIAEATRFYPAENYHQDYYLNNPGNAYCRAVINPKLKKFKATFSNLLKAEQHGVQ